MVILYGSYSNGTARTDSDIDVAVVVDSIGDDLLDSEAALYRLRKTIDE
jgi:predicted nucleotidyltransferase